MAESDADELDRPHPKPGRPVWFYQMLSTEFEAVIAAGHSVYLRAERTTLGRLLPDVRR